MNCPTVIFLFNIAFAPIISTLALKAKVIILSREKNRLDILLEINKFLKRLLKLKVNLFADFSKLLFILIFLIYTNCSDKRDKNLF